ncbi:hypothetical protein NPIL_471421, partial [Nephila pilipes]
MEKIQDMNNNRQTDRISPKRRKRERRRREMRGRGGEREEERARGWICAGIEEKEIGMGVGLISGL